MSDTTVRDIGPTRHKVAAPLPTQGSSVGKCALSQMLVNWMVRPVFAELRPGHLKSANRRLSRRKSIYLAISNRSSLGFIPSLAASWSYTLGFSHRPLMQPALRGSVRCCSIARSAPQLPGDSPLPFPILPSGGHIGFENSSISTAWNIKIPQHTVFRILQLKRLTSASLFAVSVSRVTLNAA